MFHVKRLAVKRVLMRLFSAKAAYMFHVKHLVRFKADVSRETHEGSGQ